MTRLSSISRVGLSLLFSTAGASFALLSGPNLQVLSGQGCKAPPSSVPLSKAGVVAVFRNETLSDLARLLRPMQFSVTSAPQGITTMNLRDAIYLGAKDGKAKLLTIWLTNRSSDSGPLFVPSDATQQAEEIAQRIAKAALPGVTFAVIGVDVSWKDWILSISRSGDVVVKGPSAIARQLRTVILNTPLTLTNVSTSSVAIPLSYGLTKQTAMQPWFYDDYVLISMLPIPAGIPSNSGPDITLLNGHAGVIVSEGFLNHVFSNEFKNKVFENTKLGEVKQGTYHVHTLSSSVSEGKLIVIGHLKESLHTRLCLDFTGDDIRPTSFDFSDSDNLKLVIELAVFKVSFNSALHPLLRPEGQQSLGEFFIGQKKLTGTALLERIQAKDQGIVVPGIFRFQGVDFY